MEHNSQWVLHPHIFLWHCDKVVMCCCFLLPPTPAGKSHSLPHASMVCAMSLILAVDCRVFSPHYWEWMEHNSQWVLHPHIFQRHCNKVVMHYCFLLPPTSAGESHSLPHASIVCAMSVILAVDCRVFSPHYWEWMEHNSQWVLHSHIFQRHCDEIVMCCCFLLPLTSAGESHRLPHASMVCAMSVILAVDCRVFSPHYWECMEHNSEWVLHPHIFQRHCNKVVMCCCFLLPLTPAGEFPSLPHASMVCAVSVILGIDCRVFSSHYWECMEHNREWVLHLHIFQRHCNKVVMCCCFLLPPTSVGKSNSLLHTPKVCAMSVILAIDCPVLSPHSWEWMEHNR